MGNKAAYLKNKKQRHPESYRFGTYGAEGDEGGGGLLEGMLRAQFAVCCSSRLCLEKHERQGKRWRWVTEKKRERNNIQDRQAWSPQRSTIVKRNEINQKKKGVWSPDWE